MIRYPESELVSPISGRIADGVTVPSWLIVGTVALALGVILGPALLGATEAGSQYLAKAARKKFKTP